MKFVNMVPILKDGMIQLHPHLLRVLVLMEFTLMQSNSSMLLVCLLLFTSKPRRQHLVISTTQKYLYVLMEAGNRLAVYVIDERRHVPVFTHMTYPLLPPGLPPRNTYRGDVCFTNRSGTYLFASTRGNSFDITGYVTAFKLGPHGNIERQLYINPTSNSGGHSNAVSPCDFSDEWMAICDDQDGFVEMYRVTEGVLSRVARIDIPEKGFCMNAVWYD